MATTLTTVDIAKWQADSDIDWAALKAGGVTSVIIQLSHGHSQEEEAAAHIASAEKYGIIWHGYHFYEGTAGEVEFSTSNAQSMGLKSGAYMFLDMEGDFGGDWQQQFYDFRTVWLAAGWKTGVYISDSPYTAKFDDAELTADGVYRWIAAYSYEPANYDIWQYSSTGGVPGYSKDIDKDYDRSGKLSQDYTAVKTDPYNPPNPVAGAHVGVGVDTTGLAGGQAYGYSTNGSDFYTALSPYGFIFRQRDADRMWPLLKPKIGTIQGAKGDKGDKGDTGPAGKDGIQGPKGDTGATGPQGVPGPKGDPGPAGADGKDGAQGPAGKDGAKGDTGATGAPGKDGTPGKDGAAATIAVGTVTTGAAGTSAAVTNAGTANAAKLNFTIPQGAKGDKGDTGAAGKDGTDWRNLYTDTKSFADESIWYNYTNSTKVDGNYNGYTIMQANTMWLGLGQLLWVKAGETYTFSAFARYASGTGTSTIYWLPVNSDGTTPPAVVTIRSTDVDLTSEWQRISSTTTVTQDGYILARTERGDSNSNTLQVAGLKLERGSSATAPAPSVDDLVTVYDPQTVIGSKNFNGGLNVNNQPVATQQWSAGQYRPKAWTVIADAGHDLNTVTQDGRYWCKATMGNAPAGNWAYLFVDSADPSRVMQRWVGDTTAQVYVRMCNSSSWTSWKEVTYW